MIRLYDKDSGAELGTITREQLQFLVDQLEEESLEDRDYYINRSTIEYFREIAGTLEALLAVLGRALGEREEMEIRWGEDGEEGSRLEAGPG